MSKRPFSRIAYVCSPLAGNIENNMKRAADFCRFVLEYNYIPFAPHLLFPQFMNDNNPAERKVAIIMSMEMLKKSDELWVFSEDGNISNGMSAEISKAQELGIPINYFTGTKEQAESGSYIPSCEIHKNSNIDMTIQAKIEHGMPD